MAIAKCPEGCGKIVSSLLPIHECKPKKKRPPASEPWTAQRMTDFLVKRLTGAKITAKNLGPNTIKIVSARGHFIMTVARDASPPTYRRS